MSPEDVGYYRERVAKAREAARMAATPAIAEAHTKLVNIYENLIERALEAQSVQDVDPLPTSGAQEAT
jgi:hypothetical protein